MQSIFRFGLLILFLFAAPLYAQSEAGPLMTLLKSGRLAPEKQGTVLRLIAQRGNGQDLAYLLDQSIDPKGFTPANRQVALEGLEEAFLTRKTKPTGDLSKIKGLLNTGEVASQASAMRLVGHWKVEPAREAVKTVALTASTPDSLRRAAVEGLVGLGGPESFGTLKELGEKGANLQVRYLAAAGLARLAPDRAAPIAARILAGGNDLEDPAPLIRAFLDQKTGADVLARALSETKPNGDAARMSLRTMYALGRSDPALTEILSKAAGIQLNPTKPTPAQIKALAEEVLSKGDAARGEAIFRRLDLSCFRCHALHGAGGTVGPDLRVVGTTSPADYLLRAILDPAADVKEEYMAQRIATDDGKIFQGIVVEEDNEKLVIRDANGERKTIQIKEIEERDKGGSLMPGGLANFLTQRELVDLVRYLGELGKPGPYALPTTTSVRRWKVLREVPSALLTTIPDSATLNGQVLSQPATKWVPAYAMTSGSLPLGEIAQTTGNKVLYLVGEVEVTSEGAVGLELNNPEGVTLWVGNKVVPLTGKPMVELPSGKTSVTVRVDLGLRKTQDLQLNLTRPEGSTAEFTAVGGP
jgi:putative heme-binding domain-containing protein